MTRILLSTIGSRGDVQPMIGLALAARELGHDVRLCVPPDFRDWIEQMGFAVTTIGPELRSTGRATPTASTISPEQRRQMIEGTIAAQFKTIAEAAVGCELIVGATALQVAAPSVAEHMGIPYVFAAYCPAVLPSPHHAPPVLPSLGDASPPAMQDYSELWAQDARRWNDSWTAPLNAQRASLGLSPVTDVRRYVHTDRPWLAADQTLAPWPEPADDRVFQPGAWILPDERPLSAEVDAFLDGGDAPVYFGFGSNPAPENLSRVMIESARALGRRAIVLRGWADLSLIDDKHDCLSIGEINQQALFKRVAAVVHHGGAGTTTAATHAGTPQVVVPHHYDQFYFAQRVHDLGIGIAHGAGTPTTRSLATALAAALEASVAVRAQSIAGIERGDGARTAAERISIRAFSSASATTNDTNDAESQSD